MHTTTSYAVCYSTIRPSAVHATAWCTGRRAKALAKPRSICRTLCNAPRASFSLQGSPQPRSNTPDTLYPRPGTACRAGLLPLKVPSLQGGSTAKGHLVTAATIPPWPNPLRSKTHRFPQHLGARRKKVEVQGKTFIVLEGTPSTTRTRTGSCEATATRTAIFRKSGTASSPTAPGTGPRFTFGAFP